MSAPPQIQRPPTWDLLEEIGSTGKTLLSAIVEWPLSPYADQAFREVAASYSYYGVSIQCSADTLQLHVTSVSDDSLADAAREAVLWLTEGLGDDPPGFSQITLRWTEHQAEVRAARSSLAEALERL